MVCTIWGAQTIYNPGFRGNRILIKAGVTIAGPVAQAGKARCDEGRIWSGA